MCSRIPTESQEVVGIVYDLVHARPIVYLEVWSVQYTNVYLFSFIVYYAARHVVIFLQEIKLVCPLPHLKCCFVFGSEQTASSTY